MLVIDVGSGRCCESSDAGDQGPRIRVAQVVEAFIEDAVAT